MIEVSERAGLRCLTALDRVEIEPGMVIVVRGDDGLPAWLADAAARLTGTTVLTAAQPRDVEVEAELARRRPTGRADVVLVGNDARQAVRSVRRGGVVCIGGAEPVLPSITEVVQREVRLVGPAAPSERVLAAIPPH